MQGLQPNSSGARLQKYIQRIRSSVLSQPGANLLRFQPRYQSILILFRTFYDVHTFLSSIASLPALPQFCIQGIITAAAAGFVILLFLELKRFGLFLFLPKDSEPNEKPSEAKRAMTHMASSLALIYGQLDGCLQRSVINAATKAGYS